MSIVFRSLVAGTLTIMASVRTDVAKPRELANPRAARVFPAFPVDFVTPAQPSN